MDLIAFSGGVWTLGKEVVSLNGPLFGQRAVYEGVRWIFCKHGDLFAYTLRYLHLSDS